LLPFCRATDSSTVDANNCMSASCSSILHSAYCCQGSRVMCNRRLTHLTTFGPNDPVASGERGDSSSGPTANGSGPHSVMLPARQGTLAALALTPLPSRHDES